MTHGDQVQVVIETVSSGILSDVLDGEVIAWALPLSPFVAADMTLVEEGGDASAVAVEHSSVNGR